MMKQPLNFYCGCFLHLFSLCRRFIADGHPSAALQLEQVISSYRLCAEIAEQDSVPVSAGLPSKENPVRVPRIYTITEVEHALIIPSELSLELTCSTHLMNHGENLRG